MSDPSQIPAISWQDLVSDHLRLLVLFQQHASWPRPDRKLPGFRQPCKCCQRWSAALNSPSCRASTGSWPRRRPAWRTASGGSIQTRTTAGPTTPPAWTSWTWASVAQSTRSRSLACPSPWCSSSSPCWSSWCSRPSSVPGTPSTSTCSSAWPSITLPGCSGITLFCSPRVFGPRTQSGVGSSRSSPPTSCCPPTSGCCAKELF